MAIAEDIRLKIGCFDNPKFRRLKRKVGADGIVALINLWMFAAVHRQNGRLTAMTCEDIADAADWDGDVKEFIEALLGSDSKSKGFLEQDKKGVFVIHDWEEHQPWVFHGPDRSKRAKEGNRVRWGADSSGKSRSQLLSEAKRKGTHTEEQWRDLLKITGNKCLRCLSSDDLVKDHIIPLYQGGSDGIENIQPLCRHCNSSKGKKSEDLRPKDWKLKMPRERLENASCNEASSRHQGGAKDASDASTLPYPSPSPLPSPNKTDKEHAVPKDSGQEVEWPGVLKTDRFKKAWLDWIEYRRQARLKRYTAIGAERQLRELAEIGETRAVAAIEYSIRQAYQGIHEDGKNANRQGAQQAGRYPGNPSELA